MEYMVAMRINDLQLHATPSVNLTNRMLSRRIRHETVPRY